MVWALLLSDRMKGGANNSEMQSYLPGNHYPVLVKALFKENLKWNFLKKEVYYA
jgi:hypothetical protein